MTEEISEEENIKRYEAAMELIHDLLVPKFIEWWRVESTGWSNGMSWFDDGNRLNTQEEAITYIARNRWDDPSVKWRYVHVTLEREGNKSVTTEVWTEVP